MNRVLDCSYVGDALTEDEYRNLGMPVPPQTEVKEETILALNISQVRSGRWSEVEQEIGSVVEAAHSADRKVKVIFENCYLTDEEKIRLCQICGEVNADWVKTSTGFGSGGATFEDLLLMRHHTPQHVQVGSHLHV